MAILAAVAGAAVGALLTVIIKGALDRRTESRMARREFYVELMTLLVGRRRAMSEVTLAPDEQMEGEIDQGRMDAFDARLMIDATPEVRELASTCFALLQRFNNSYVVRAPAEVDEHGLFRYRFDMVRDKPPEGRSLIMRVTLGEMLDQYSVALDSLGARVRVELHGERS